MRRCGAVLYPKPGDVASKRNATLRVLGRIPPLHGEGEANLGEIELVTGQSGLMYLVCPGTWKPADMQMQTESSSMSPRYVVVAGKEM